MVKDILSDISSQFSGFSKGQKRIADFILHHYDKAAYMTASKLGRMVSVSESTVVRFANELGYDGYPSMQRALQEMIRNRLTTLQRIEVTRDLIGNGDVLDKVMNMDIERIKHTLEETSRESFQQAVDAIVSAKTIYVIGARSASVLARFITYYFNLMFENVKLVHTTSSSEMFEQIMRMTDQDVMIGISFPRYSKHTVKAFHYATSCGAKVVALTDSYASPIAQSADYVLIARSDMASFVDSFVAPLSLIDALIVAIGVKKRADVSETFEKLERIWDEYEVYEKVEDKQEDGSGDEKKL